MHHLHRHHHQHHRFQRHGAALVALGLGLAAGILGCDDHAEHHDHDDPGDRASRILGRIDATAAERDALRPLLHDLFAEMTALRGRSAAFRKDVVGGWRGETLDPTRLRERADVELEALREAAQRVSERLAALHAAMTPAQREQLVRAMSGGRPRWRD
jgi:hypothetical protein